MKKVLLSTLAIVVFSAMTANVYATDESTVSVGYAQSHVKVDGNKLDEKPKGFNLKYRYEIDDNWGVLASFAYTHQGYDFYHGGSKVGTGDLDYYSWTMGPAYRFNDYISAYGLIGGAKGRVKVSTSYGSEKESKTSLAYGAGLQFNPYPNIAIDASYEYSKLGDFKVGTWMIGAGYRF